MGITERQKLILDRVVKEYIDSALPISSQLLEKKYDFGISPPMIRIEMQRLTEKGYLYQPYTSAGRIPTDKGYRFFVNDLSEEDLLNFDKRFYNEIHQIEKEFEDSLKFIQILTKRMAEITSNLVVSYLDREGIVFKEGWEEVSREPEFKDSNYFSKFIDMMEDWEENIEDIEILSELKIYIGKENPLPKAKEFSTIISPCSFTQDQKGVLAILGPKRMAYDKNISLINSLTKLLEKL